MNANYYEQKVFKYINDEYSKLLFWAKFKYFFISLFKKISFEYPSFHFRGIWDRDGINEDINEYTKKYGNKGTWKNANLSGPDWDIFIPFLSKKNKSENMVIETQGEKFDDIKETVFPSDFRTLKATDKDFKVGQVLSSNIVTIADDLTEKYRYTDFEIIANHKTIRVSIKCTN